MSNPWDEVEQTAKSVNPKKDKLSELQEQPSQRLSNKMQAAASLRSVREQRKREAAPQRPAFKVM